MKKIISILMICFLCIGCGKNNNSKSVQLNELGLIAFETITDWRKEEKEDFTYFYFTDDNTDGFLMVSAYDIGYDIDGYHSVLVDAILKGMNITDSSDIDVSKFKCVYDLSGKSYTQSANNITHKTDTIYVFDDTNDYIYLFSFIFNENTVNLSFDDIANVINSIKSNSNGSVTNIQKIDNEPTFDNEILMGDFGVTFYSQYTLTTVNNRYSDYNGKDVIRIPAKIKNNGTETAGLNQFYINIFGSKGTELDSVAFYFDDSLEQAGELRPGAETSCALYLLYDGDGDYFVEYDDWSNKVEVKLPIALDNTSNEILEVDTNNSASNSGVSGFNNTYNFNKFEITFGDSFTFDTVNNRFSDLNGSKVVKIPVHIRNISDETQGINMFYLTYFGSKGSELDTVYSYFDNSLERSGDLRPGAEKDSYIYMLYDGDGDYYVVYDDYSYKTEVVLPIANY